MAEFLRNVMTPGAVAVRPDASLVEAAQLMRAPPGRPAGYRPNKARNRSRNKAGKGD